MRAAVIAGALLSGTLFLGVTTGFAQQPAPNGEQIFNTRCKSCHEPAIPRAPDRSALKNRTNQDIIDSLTNGAMQPMAAGLTQPDIRAVASFLTGVPIQTAQAPAGRGGAAAPAPDSKLGPTATPTGTAPVDKMCASNPPLTPVASQFNGSGADLVGSHYQRNPGLKAADVPKLKVKWAFSMAGGSYGQPTAFGGRIFISGGQRAYSLDAKTGCVYWVANVAGRSRTTMEIVRMPGVGSGWVTFLADRQRNIVAMDAQDGKELWKTNIEAYARSTLTGAPIYYNGKVYAPVSGAEETAATANTFECCRFRGSVAALDAKTGKMDWKTYVIDETPRPTKKNSAGTQMYGPAGAGIWSAPVIDVKRNALYVATGDSYTSISEDGSDAIVAISLKDGKILWKNQVLANDAYIVGCDRTPKPANCPEVLGPDFDYGASPIIKRVGNKDLVFSGNKSGSVYAMDADTGKTVWQQKIGQGSAIGGVEWGIAADDKYLYVPVSDMLTEYEKYGKGRPGLSALEFATGREIWHVDAPKVKCSFEDGTRRGGMVPLTCSNAQSAAIAVMPGVVFSGTMDGWFRAYDSDTGKIIWEQDTAGRTYDTVNGIRGQKGGSIDGMGPTIAGGMVYTWSGYAGAQAIGSNPYNVLIAYSVDGK